MPTDRAFDGAYACTNIYDCIGEEPAVHPDLEAVFKAFPGSPILLSIMVRVGVEMAEYGLDARSDEGQQLAARVIRGRMTKRDSWYDSTPEALERQAAIERSAGTAFVYYLDLYGTAIKIGTSTNVLQRIKSLRRSTIHLLALEPGGYAVEKMRHRQFSRERHESGLEDFSRSPRLLAHIERLTAKHGSPLQVLETAGRNIA